MPFFSIIIPLYNKEHYIEATLKSVINQTFEDFEVIIVDDGSTDQSLKKASQINDSRITIIQQKNKGASSARNKGIEEVNGQYIALLDADDFWYKNHLSELKKLIGIFPKAGLFCSNYQVKRSKNSITPATFHFNYSTEPVLVSNFFEANTIDCIPTSSSVAFLKASFNKLGGYNLSFRSGQDTDLWIRFGLNYDIVFTPAITMIYNNYDRNSLSKSKYNIDRYKLINSYKNEEIKNKFLKKYLDINRYAVALRCKLNNEQTLYKRLKAEIDYKNLNIKQLALLQLPTSFLRLSKRIQYFFIKRNLYLTAYK